MGRGPEKSALSRTADSPGVDDRSELVNRIWRYRLSKRRKNGMRHKNPKRSVSTPGVTSTAAATRMSAPSRSGSAGDRPSARSLRRRASVLRPCCRASDAPTIPVPTMSTIVITVPIRCPTSIRRNSSTTGRVTKSSSKRPTRISCSSRGAPRLRARYRNEMPPGPHKQHPFR